MGDNNKLVDVLIVGGGPAGLAAAISAREQGIQNILILERENKLGGILQQCIHNGFGLHTFNEELTGPEYAKRFIDKVESNNIPYKLNSTVLNISKDKVVTYVSKEEGIQNVKAKTIILAMGCRERPRGALNIPGYRPAGIYSAGTVQKLVNMEGFLPGKNVVILGSGDIGLIMARRLTLSGAKVNVVAELLPFSSGLKRNIVQCLDDYNIPLQLSHTVTEIKGKQHIEAVVISEVDEKLKPIPGTEKEYKCDLLLLSVGLIPENELSIAMGVELSPITSGAVVNESLETNIPGVFACGNVLHVHDLVDFVSREAKIAGRNAANYVNGKIKESKQYIKVNAIEGVRYVVPQKVCIQNMDDEIVFRFRVDKVYKNAAVGVYFDNEQVQRNKKMIFAPGEMEEVTVKKQDLIDKNVNEITLRIEQ